MRIYLNKLWVESTLFIALMPIILVVLLFLFPTGTRAWYTIVIVVPIYLLIAPIVFLVSYNVGGGVPILPFEFQLSLSAQGTVLCVVLEFERNNRLHLLGTLGSHTLAIRSVLESFGVESTALSGLSQMTQPGIYIVTCYNALTIWGGMHTYAIAYDGNVYTAYNLYGNGKEYPIVLGDLKDYLACVYYLGG